MLNTVALGSTWQYVTPGQTCSMEHHLGFSGKHLATLQ